MSSRTSPKNNQELRILTNALVGVDPKTIFDKIKLISKQTNQGQELQVRICKQLSLLLRMTVSVSVVPIAEMPQHLSHERQLHPYPQAQAVLEDAIYHYRIWIKDSPQTTNFPAFRQPVDTKLKQITVKPQDYEQAS